MKSVKIFISAIRLIPHIILLNIHKNRNVIKYDVRRWLSKLKLNHNTQFGFLALMTSKPEFRNLFYYRIGGIAALIRWLCPQMNTLFINSEKIGPGLFIQHGFSTIIGAKIIGKNCWINQQVTIGHSNETDSPKLGDNVEVKPGARIIGKVSIGNNSIVGLNTVVLNDVPDNCTVFGIPAKVILRRKEKSE